MDAVRACEGDHRASYCACAPRARAAPDSRARAREHYVRLQCGRESIRCFPFFTGPFFIFVFKAMAYGEALTITSPLTLTSP